MRQFLDNLTLKKAYSKHFFRRKRGTVPLVLRFSISIPRLYHYDMLLYSPISRLQRIYNKAATTYAQVSNTKKKS